MTKAQRSAVEEARRDFLRGQLRTRQQPRWDWRHFSPARLWESALGLAFCLLYLLGSIWVTGNLELSPARQSIIIFGGEAVLLLSGYLRHRRLLRRVTGLDFAEAPEVFAARKKLFETFLGGAVTVEDLLPFQPGSSRYGTVQELAVETPLGEVKRCRLSFDWYRGTFHLESVAQ